MPISILVGGQWGDEGKAQAVDDLLIVSQLWDDPFTTVAGFNGGANAGREMSNERGSMHLHQLPPSALHERIDTILGTGMFLNVIKLAQELDEVADFRGSSIPTGRLAVATSAHLAMPHHIWKDEQSERGANRQETTKSGIRYTAGEKAERIGKRAGSILTEPDALFGVVLERLIETGNEQIPMWRRFKRRDMRAEAERTAELWAESAERIAPYLTNTVALLHHKLDNGEHILAEGAQGTWLDLDHGLYPYGTSSNTIAGGALTGLGFGPREVDQVYGLIKAYKTRVGKGPFPTEITDPDFVKSIRGEPGMLGAEFGGTTGRERRIGFLDLFEVARSIRLSGVTQLIFTKLDLAPTAAVDGRIKVAVDYEIDGERIGNPMDIPTDPEELAKCIPVYEHLGSWDQDVSDARRMGDLNGNAEGLVHFVEDYLEVKAAMVRVGPSRGQLILPEAA
jgi:adenylosuccinate synthase